MLQWLALLAALTAAGAAASVARNFRRRLPPTTRGMKQLARNPQQMALFAKELEDRRQFEATAHALTDDELRNVIERVLARESDAARALNTVAARSGLRLEPLLVAALADPRAQVPEGDAQLNRYPVFAHLSAALARIGSGAAIPRLARLLSSRHSDLRAMAAKDLATIGSPSAIEPTRQALNDESATVRLNARIGVRRAAEYGHAGPEFRAAIVESLKPITTGDSQFNQFDDRDACDALMSLDPAAATAHLASPCCLRPDNPHVSSALAALNKANIRIDPALLKPILGVRAGNAAAPKPEIRERLAWSAALVALALSDPASAEPEIANAIRLDDPLLRDGGVAGLLRLHRLPDPQDLLHSTDLPGGFDALPISVQRVIASVEFENEVNNGGISQYLFNSAGDHWPVALEAFREMGCVNCADILAQAIAFVGPAGSSTDRETRMDAYAKLSDDREAKLDDLSGRFFKYEDRVDVLRAQYMVRHADEIGQIAAKLPKRRFDM